MASKPNAKRIAEILTDKADEVLSAIATGKDLDQIGREWGIYPFHIKKFYANSVDHRDRFRESMVSWQRMRVEAKTAKGKKKRGNGEASELIARNVDSILQLVSDGVMLGEIGELFELSRSTISEWFNSQDDDMKARYEAAKTEGGHALAEKSVQVTLRPIFDLTDAKTAELQARQLAWLAGKRNPVYGDKQQVDVNHKVQGAVTITIDAN